jgi:tetratricopeptide (TPR) repeat protein
MSPDDVEYGIRLTEAQISGGRSKEALVALEALRKRQAPLSDDPRIDIAAARAFQELGDFRQQQHLAARAAGNASSRGARLLVARARLLEATAQDALGEPGRAAAAVEEARRLFEAAGDRTGTARALERMALGLDNRGDLGGARRIYERSLTIYREIGDKGSTARVESNIATNLLQQGRTAEAQKLYDQSLSTFRQIGARYEEAALLNDIGARLQNAGDLAGAQKRYEAALAIFGQIGERSGVATALTNLAEILFARGDLPQAQQMHEESLAINREAGYKSGAGYDLYRLGEVFTAKGDLQVAKDRYEEALSIQTELKEAISAARTRLGLAALAVADGRSAEGETLASQAEEVLRVEKATDLHALAQAVLSEALLAQGKLPAAQKASDAALKLLSKSDDRHVRLAAAIAAARARAASRQPAEIGAALQALERTRAEAAASGLLNDQYEATLALGTLEIASGRAGAGRARVQALAAEAGAKGFGLIARRAQQALSSS